MDRRRKKSHQRRAPGSIGRRSALIPAKLAHGRHTELSAAICPKYELQAMVRRTLAGEKAAEHHVVRHCARWLQHFAEMDRLYEAACFFESAIEDCIGAEQYEEATRLREAYARVQEQDDVNTVLKVWARSERRPPRERLCDHTLCNMLWLSWCGRRVSALSLVTV